LAGAVDAVPFALCFIPLFKITKINIIRWKIQNVIMKFLVMENFFSPTSFTTSVSLSPSEGWPHIWVTPKSQARYMNLRSASAPGQQSACRIP
jgi:hypothetical protein